MMSDIPAGEVRAGVSDVFLISIVFGYYIADKETLFCKLR